MGKINRLISAVLVFSFVFWQTFVPTLAKAGPIASPPMLVYLDQVSLDPGSTAKLGLYAENVPSSGLAGFQVSIGYDPQVVRIVGVEQTSGSKAAFAQFAVNILPDRIELVGADATGTDQALELAELEVQAAGGQGRKSALTLTVAKATDRSLNDIPYLAQAGTVAINYHDEVYLSSVQDLYQTAAPAADAAAWTGLPQHSPAAGLNVQAGDLLLLKAANPAGQGAQAGGQSALLPEISSGLLISTDGTAVRKLANLAPALPGLRGAVPALPDRDFLVVRVPRNLPAGDYILTAAVNEQVMAKLPGSSSLAAVTLHVDPKWLAESLISPWPGDPANPLDPQKITTDFALVTQMSQIRGLPLPDADKITIDWTSSNPAYLTVASLEGDGNAASGLAAVTRPGFRDGNAKVVLQATLHWGSNSRTVSFPLTILAKTSLSAEDEAILIADNLISLLGDTAPLRSLTAGTAASLPVAATLGLGGGRQAFASISWTVVEADGEVSDNVAVDPQTGAITVTGQPAVGEPDEVVWFRAAVSKDGVQKTATSTGQALGVDGIVLAASKPLDAIRGETDDLRASLDNPEGNHLDAAAAAAALEKDLAQAIRTAPDMAAVQDQIQALLVQLRQLVPSLAASLLQGGAADQAKVEAAAGVLEQAAAIAEALGNRPELANAAPGTQLDATITSVLTVTEAISQAASLLPQDSLAAARARLAAAYTQVAKAASASKAVALAGDSGSLGSRLADAATAIVAQLDSLKQTVTNIGLDGHALSQAVAVKLDATNLGNAALHVPAGSLEVLAGNDLGLDLTLPAAGDAASPRVALPPAVLSQAAAQAGAAGDLQIIAEPVPQDPSLAALAGDAAAMVVPFKVEFRSADGSELRLADFPAPVWLTVPLQEPMTVAKASAWRDQGKLVVQYYSPTAGVWRNLTADPESIVIDPVRKTVSFPTTHFTQFVVATKSADALLDSLQVQAGGTFSAMVDTGAVLSSGAPGTALVIPLSQDPLAVQVQVTPHDPAAGVSGTFSAAGGGEQPVEFAAMSRDGSTKFAGQFPLTAEGGTAKIAVSAVDGTTNTYTLVLTALAAAPHSSAAAPLAGLVGQQYTQLHPLARFTAAGGQPPYTWNIKQGRLPAGLSLAPIGALVGTPTESGDFELTLTVTDASDPALTLEHTAYLKTVAEAQILTASLPPATVGVSYQAALQGSGGDGNYVWQLAAGSSLPAGLSLSAAGVLSGVPQQAGSQSFTVELTDETAVGVFKTSRELSLTVNPPGSGGGSGGGGGGAPGGSGAGPVNGFWPVQPTPLQQANARASQTVMPGQNGQLAAADGTKVAYSGDSCSAPLTITIGLGTIGKLPQSATVKMFDPVLSEREFGPSGSQFDAPVNITLSYAALELGDVKPEQLALYWWQGSDWVKVGGVVDAVHKTVTAPVYHFSTYAVMADLAPAAERLAGSDRFATAAAVSRQGWQQGAENVVLVQAYAFPDALAATPLALKLGAPILLTGPDEVPEPTLTEIKRLQAKNIVLVGSTGVVGAAVEQELRSAGYNITRYGGKDRYETAAAVAAALGSRGRAAVVSGDDGHYADALSISAWAAFHGVPILYTQTAQIPDATAAILGVLGVKSTVLAGGPAAVGEKVAAELPAAERYAGADRFATAAAIASGLSLNPARLYVATGLDFVDALVAGNLAARTNSPLLLVDHGLPAPTLDYIKKVGAAIGGFTVIGGPGVVSEAQAASIRALMPQR